MNTSRRKFLAMLPLAAAGISVSKAVAESAVIQPREVLVTWWTVLLELVRHTATYSPPVASRSFAYLSVAGYEVMAALTPGRRSLAGQMNGLTALPAPPAGAEAASALHAALTSGMNIFFGNTGPTGQRVIENVTKKLGARTAEAAGAANAASVAWGEAVTAHIAAWAKDDGGAVIENMGFPLDYAVSKEPGRWVPTSAIRQQQAPLLPKWGENRTFAMPAGQSCPLPPPPAYSEDAASQFHKEAVETQLAVVNATDEHKIIARFWSDDPMLSPTPPGHWISIVLQIAERDAMPADKLADVLARLSVTLADAFIGCWASKYEFDFIRPVTYIKQHIDPKWEPLLITPPFPEYPSGHSTQSGAAEVVLTAFFGEQFAFDDATHERDGIKPRKFANFREAAEEAGISRLYGGIHFRAAIERGLDQGRCIGAHAVALKTVL